VCVVMYVSRLVYIVCLLEAVLWIQPNFALSNQRDMAKLLQSQTHKLNELAQNAAKDNTFSVLQKQLEMAAREQEMVARANLQIRNMQTALLDKVAAKQTTVNRAQLLPQLLVGHDDGGNSECGGAAGKVEGEKGVANGAVPLMPSNQAYTVACCLLVACITLFLNESSPLPETSESNTAEAVTEDALKRPRDADNDEDDDCAVVEEGRHGRKRARLGVHTTSPVQSLQANKKKNCCNNKRRCKSDTVSSRMAVDDSDMVQSVASEESIACSPTLSLSSGADSPKDIQVSSPNSVPVAVSGVFSTLPPELACEFEAEHAFYFHGIACPSGNAVPQQAMPPVSVYPIYDRVAAAAAAAVSISEPQPQRITAIDPAVLLVEPSTPELPQQDDGFTPSLSSGQSSEVDDEEEETTSAPVTTAVAAPLFNVEPLLQDEYFC